MIGKRMSARSLHSGQESNHKAAELDIVSGKIRIRYTKSSIGYEGSQKATLNALGLRKLNQIVVHDDTAVIRGMVKKVSHLVAVEEVE